MSTLKQKKAFRKTIENLASDNPKTKKQILAESGYPNNTQIKPSQVYNSKYFQEKLAQLDDTLIIEKWYQWANSDTDRRAALEAGDKIMKLKDRYPARKTKISALFETISYLEEEEEAG